MMRPATGQPNLSLPEAAGSGAGAAGVATGAAVLATCWVGAVAAGAGAATGAGVAVVAAWSTLVPPAWSGLVDGMGAAMGVALATWVVGVAGSVEAGACGVRMRSDRPGMRICWPTTMRSGELRLLACTMDWVVTSYLRAMV